MFNNRNFSVIAYANGFTLWHYRTDDILARVESPKYFDTVKNIIADKNIVVLNCKDCSCIREFNKNNDIITLKPLGD